MKIKLTLKTYIRTMKIQDTNKFRKSSTSGTRISKNWKKNFNFAALFIVYLFKRPRPQWTYHSKLQHICVCINICWENMAMANINIMSFCWDSSNCFFPVNASNLPLGICSYSSPKSLLAFLSKMEGRVPFLDILVYMAPAFLLPV